MPARPLLAFECAGAAGIDVRPVECHDRFAAGQKDAAELARFPHVAQRPQLEIDLDAAGDRQFELLQFLRLVSIGRGPDL